MPATFIFRKDTQIEELLHAFHFSWVHIDLHSAQTAQFLVIAMFTPELLLWKTTQHLVWTSMHNSKGSSTMLRVQKYVKHTIGRVFSQNIAY
jgi:hypothetical protein